MKWRKRHGKVLRWNKKHLINTYGAWCQIGNHPIENMKDITLDHKIPKIRGGTDQLENLQLACLPHNREKGVMTPEEFEKLQGL
jgi:5-methylcytosine-specific restriction endonuclease McrA